MKPIEVMFAEQAERLRRMPIRATQPHHCHDRKCGLCKRRIRNEDQRKYRKRVENG